MYGVLPHPTLRIRLNFSGQFKDASRQEQKQKEETAAHHVIPATKDERAARTPYCLDVFDRSRILPTLDPLPQIDLFKRLLVAYYHLVDAALDRVHDALMHSPTLDGPRVLYASWMAQFEGAHVQRWVPSLDRVKSILQCVFEPHVVPQTHAWHASRGQTIRRALLEWMSQFDGESLDLWDACGSERSFWQFWVMACWCVERFVFSDRDASLRLSVCPMLWAHWNAHADAFASVPHMIESIQDCRVIASMEDYPFNASYNLQLPHWLSLRPGASIIAARSGDLLLSMLSYTWYRSIECCAAHPEDWEWYSQMGGERVMVLNAEMPDQEEWISCHPCRATFYAPSPPITMGEFDDSSSSSSDSDSDSE